MSGLRVLGALFMTPLLLLTDCGGRATADPSSGAAGDVNGGAANAIDECLGGAPDGGCGGEAGEQALEDYARLRTACGRSITINRRGDPVTVCYHIR